MTLARVRAPALARGRNSAHSFNGSCKSVSTAGALDRRTLYNEGCQIEPTTRDAPYFSIFAFNSFLLNRIQDNRECDEEKSQAASICEPSRQSARRSRILLLTSFDVGAVTTELRLGGELMPKTR